MFSPCQDGHVISFEFDPSMEIQAQVEILEAEVALLRRSGTAADARRLQETEARLREALALAHELDLEIYIVQHQALDEKQNFFAVGDWVDYPKPQILMFAAILGRHTIFSTCNKTTNIS